MANRKDTPVDKAPGEPLDPLRGKFLAPVFAETNAWAGTGDVPGLGPVADDTVPAQQTQRQTYGPAMPTIQLDPGLHAQDYLDRMRRGQSTDSSNDYED